MDLIKDAAGTVLVDYALDTLSRRTGISRANGHTSSYGYEPDSDLSSITHNTLLGTPTLSFGHNGAHQIVSIGTNSASLDWIPAASSTVGYVPNALNQYASVNGITLTYDTKGNLTGDGTATYAFDAENKLTTAVKGGVTSTYGYDGLGRRIAKTVGGTATQFLLDGDEDIAEYTSGGAVLRRYVNGASIDDHAIMFEGTSALAANARYYYTNHQGSTLRVADASGTITDSFTYGSYGESSYPTGNPFQYTGRRYDPETGLYYYRARYYSPQQGRFLQTDPIGYRDDLNLYAYVGNDPLNLTDPSGLTWEEFWAGLNQGVVDYTQPVGFELDSSSFPGIDSSSFSYQAGQALGGGLAAANDPARGGGLQGVSAAPVKKAVETNIIKKVVVDKRSSIADDILET